MKLAKKSFRKLFFMSPDWLKNIVPTRIKLHYSHPSVRWALLILLVLQVAFQVRLLWKGQEYIVSKLTIDDTYYYLQTAWNMKTIGTVTFDGVHPTNGVQFLWFWVLFFLSWLAKTKIIFLYLSLILCIILNAVVYLAIFDIDRTVNRKIFTIMLGVSWFGFNVIGVSTYLTGMENSLHAVIVWFIVAQVLQLAYADQFGMREKNVLLWFTILLVMNVWARIDAVILSLLFFIIVILIFRTKISQSTIMLSFSIAVFGAMFLFAGFYLMGGTLLPVSGLIKSGHYHFDARLLAVLFSRSFNVMTPIQYLIWHISGKQYHSIVGGIVLGILSFVGAVLYLRKKTYWNRSLTPIWWALAISTFSHLVYTSGLGIFAEYGIWYQSPYFIFSALSLALLVDGLLDDSCNKNYFRLTRIALAGAFVLYSVFIGRWMYRDVIDTDYVGGLYYSRLELAKWIDLNLPDEARLASFNAGQIGFFSDRSTINLDGLVNTSEYYRTVLLGEADLIEYLQNNQVDYFVDYRVPAQIRDISVEVHRYQVHEAEARSYTLYVLQLP